MEKRGRKRPLLDNKEIERAMNSVELESAEEKTVDLR